MADYETQLRALLVDDCHRLYPTLYTISLQYELHGSAPHDVQKHKDGIELANGRVEQFNRTFPGKIPHAVLATDLLSSALIFFYETAQRKRAAAGIKKAAHMSIAAALMKAVSGFVDPLQEYFFGSSMLDIASRIGLDPAWVKMRHAVAHNNMPDEDQLATTCEEIRLWIADVFWLRLDRGAQDLAALFRRVDPCILGHRPPVFGQLTETQIGAEVARSLKSFRNQRRTHVRKHKTYPAQLTANLEWIGQIDPVVGVNAVLDCLLEPGMMIPAVSRYTELSSAQKKLAVLFLEPLVRELIRLVPALRQLLVARLISSIPSTTAQEDPEDDVQIRQLWVEHLLDQTEDRLLIARRRATHPSTWILRVAAEIRDDRISLANCSPGSEDDILLRQFVYGADEWLGGFNVRGSDELDEGLALEDVTSVLARREAWLCKAFSEPVGGPGFYQRQSCNQPAPA